MALSGTAHGAEGLTLEELALTSGDAQLRAHGSLLGPRQDAHLSLSDCPAALLQPLYRALPALQVSGRGVGGVVVLGSRVPCCEWHAETAACGVVLCSLYAAWTYGFLLGPRQDAHLSLSDCPAALLQPLYRALPALQVGGCACV